MPCLATYVYNAFGHWQHLASVISASKPCEDLEDLPPEDAARAVAVQGLAAATEVALRNLAEARTVKRTSLGNPKWKMFHGLSSSPCIFIAEHLEMRQDGSGAESLGALDAGCAFCYRNMEIVFVKLI